MEKVQEFLFEHKEELSNDMYVKFMNILKDCHENTDEFYEVSYIHLYPEVTGGRMNNYKLTVDFHGQTITKIINIKEILKQHCGCTQPFVNKVRAVPFVPFFSRNFDELTISNEKTLQSTVIIKEYNDDSLINDDTDIDEDDDGDGDETRAIRTTAKFDCLPACVVISSKKL